MLYFSIADDSKIIFDSHSVSKNNVYTMSQNYCNCSNCTRNKHRILFSTLESKVKSTWISTIHIKYNNQHTSFTNLFYDVRLVQYNNFSLYTLSEKKESVDLLV